MSIEDEVRKASQKFYTALTHMANGDARLMGEVWSHGADVTTMHPIGGRQVGWDAVRASFEGVAGAASDGKVTLDDQRLHVAGDVAYEIGTERGQFKLGNERVDIEQRVTNIYERQHGAWKMTHHHADTSPAMQAVLAKLQQGGR